MKAQEQISVITRYSFSIVTKCLLNIHDSCTSLKVQIALIILLYEKKLNH